LKKNEDRQNKNRKNKTWNKHKQKINKNYKKGMETNETRKGKYNKIILNEKNYKKEETK